VSDISRVAIITGGGTGIGAATARHLARQGTGVAIVGRRAEALDKTVAEIEQAGGLAMSVAADMADPSAPDRIVKAVVDRWARIDVVVNCAAAISHAPMGQIKREVIDEHYDTNIRGPILLIQAALPWLKKSDSAAIVNISSSSGSLSIPTQSIYGMTKAALEYLTRSYAAELAPFHIRVNDIAPGPVDTPIHLSWAGDDVAGAYKRMAAEVPLGRMGNADELAAWVAHLTDANGAWVTGAVIPVDGGQTLNGAMSHI
jgi:NAD(P)-dependent dehydrogenase (short-subunit alcohol dehydrogenase family)